MFGHLLGCCTIYTFSGLLPPNGILPSAKFTLRPSLAFSYIHLAALLHGTPAAGVGQSFTDAASAPPIFSWVAIKLGIGPHSSCF